MGVPPGPGGVTCILFEIFYQALLSFSEYVIVNQLPRYILFEGSFGGKSIAAKPLRINNSNRFTSEGKHGVGCDSYRKTLKSYQLQTQERHQCMHLRKHTNTRTERERERSTKLCWMGSFKPIHKRTHVHREKKVVLR